MEKGVHIEDKFLKRLLVTVGVITGTILVLLLIVYTIDALLIAFTGLLFAIILRGLMGLLQKYIPVSDGIALILVVVGLVVAAVLISTLISAPILEQTAGFEERLPEARTEIRHELEKTGLGRRALDNVPEGTELEGFVSSIGASGAFSSITGFFSATLGIISNVIVIIFLGIFLARNPETYVGNFVRLFPFSIRPRIREVMTKTGDILGKWMLSRAISMVIIFPLTLIGLTVLGTPLALVLSLINGLLAFIPLFGPIVATIPAALVGLTVSPTHMIYVIILYTVIQQGENNLITPFVEEATAKVPYGLILLAQLVMGILLGFIGLALAPPLICALTVIIRMLYVEDVLGDVQEEKEK